MSIEKEKKKKHLESIQTTENTMYKIYNDSLRLGTALYRGQNNGRNVEKDIIQVPASNQKAFGFKLDFKSRLDGSIGRYNR
jgi:hypothetical protein